MPNEIETSEGRAVVSEDQQQRLETMLLAQLEAIETIRTESLSREGNLAQLLAANMAKAALTQAALERTDTQVRWAHDELNQAASMADRNREEADRMRQERDAAALSAEQRHSEMIMLRAQLTELTLSSSSEISAARSEAIETSRDLTALRVELRDMAEEKNLLHTERQILQDELTAQNEKLLSQSNELDHLDGKLRHREAELASLRSETNELRDQMTAMELALEEQTCRLRKQQEQIERTPELIDLLVRRPTFGTVISETLGFAKADTRAAVQNFLLRRDVDLMGASNPYLRAHDLHDLLAWNDIDFVRCAYVTVLGRQPDPEGEAGYTKWIRQGRSKLEVLGQLRRSKEGAKHDPGIAGLDRAIRQSDRRRLPLFGPIIRMLGRNPEPQVDLLASLETFSREQKRIADERIASRPNAAPPRNTVMRKKQAAARAAIIHAGELEHLSPQSPMQGFNLPTAD